VVTQKHEETIHNFPVVAMKHLR